VRGGRVILYELNEVPWSVVDQYARARPSSAFASLVENGRCLTTLNEDPVHLQPWRTWPTFHTSQHTDAHGSMDLGQDPTTFRGATIWDVADDARRRVGLFGVLQSWPPRDFRAGGFHVPDTFAPTAATCPGELRRFQEFNLAVTRDSGFASGPAPRPTEMVKVGLDLLRRGLTMRSAARLVRQLVRERREPRYVDGRSLVQAIPCFDVYWALHRRAAPDLSIFFTNHVAGMMHRFWGDAMADYPDRVSYPPDPVRARFVFDAMDIADHQLRRVLRYIRSRPDTVLVLASSMGQGPIPYQPMPQTWVVTDPARLAETLGLAGGAWRAAMYPRLVLELPSGCDPELARQAVTRVRTAIGPMFDDVRTHGNTMSFEINVHFGDQPLPTTACIGGDGAEHPVAIGDLGVAPMARPGGGNTAFHTREGILVAAGGEQPRDPRRRQVSVLDAAPSILALMGLDAHPAMLGQAGLFG
jgi:hypothetical protein